MTRLFTRISSGFLALLCGSLVIALVPCGVEVLAQQPGYPSKPSWTSSITSGVKQGFDKIGNALNPKKPSDKPPPEDDAISLKSKSKPGPELYTAVARLCEEQRKWTDAEQQYQAALRLKPDHLPALLGYAQLKERLGQTDEAVRLYQQAARQHPREAAVHNNFGMCLARQGRLDEAAAALSAAVQLAPKNTLYRNNFATVLVDAGKLREAFAQLRAVHGEAAAYYNMGYLLQKKGQTLAATQHFALALRADPSMTAARHWLDYLQKSAAQARLPNHPAAGGVRITSDEATPRSVEEPSPRRLPPTAPLPPPDDSDIQPLPVVE